MQCWHWYVIHLKSISWAILVTMLTAISCCGRMGSFKKYILGNPCHHVDSKLAVVGEWVAMQCHAEQRVQNVCQQAYCVSVKQSPKRAGLRRRPCATCGVRGWFEVTNCKAAIAVAFFPISADLDASLRTCFAALPGFAPAKRHTSGSACTSHLRILPQTAHFAP